MKTEMLVTVKCLACGWAQVLEPQRSIQAGMNTRANRVLMDGHGVSCPLCTCPAFEVVGVDVHTP